MVGRLVVHDQDNGLPAARTAYDHAEFLTASDERFRPVNLTSAPDGTLYVVDMYRGIIQHRVFITGYLEQKIAERGLEQPVGLGRIWRIVHTSTTRGDAPQLSTKTPAALVQYLGHPNGWWRLTAQRLLVERGDTSVAPALRQMARAHADDRARLHALWTLDGLRQADRATIDAALGDSAPPVRAAAIRIAEPMLARSDTQLTAAVMRLTGDRNPMVRRQLAASAGELPVATREDALLDVVAHSGNDPVVADLVVTAVSGRELPFLERLLASSSREAERLAPPVRALSKALVATRNAASVQRVLALAAELARPRWQRLALLDGARRPVGQRGGFVVSLTERPAGLLAAMMSSDTALRARASQVAESLKWPGKRDAGEIVRALTPTERKRFAMGQQQFLATCAGCHQARGTGLAGVSKPLVGSSWVLGVPDRLIRIVLHGKEGTMLMPPVGASMTNDQIASVLTYVRRSWGNGASPIDPAAVHEVRGATAGRNRPWTEGELQRIRR